MRDEFRICLKLKYKAREFILISDQLIEYDYVILGGGVAGCVLASRLSECSDLNVALVEGGLDYGEPGLEWPNELLDARILPRSDMWEHGAVPSEFRGRLLGGSSCINGCWHTWGSVGDFDEWHIAGGPQWSATSLEPHREQAAATMRLREVPDSELTMWAWASLTGAADMGYAAIADMSGLCAARGVGRPPINAVGHRRINAAMAYLDGARARPNLTILPGTIVDRLVVDKERVTAVELISGGSRHFLKAKRYVLSAGTYGSPAVLLRSGIGPAGDLEKLGIDIRLDRPGVGANLMDHVSATLPLTPTVELNAALYEQERVDGLYPSQIAIKTGSSGCPQDSWDLHLLPTGGAPLLGTLPSGEYEVGLTAFLMKPRSRGKVSIVSPDPLARLQIEPRFFSDPDGNDLAALHDGLRIAWELANQKQTFAFAKIADSVPDIDAPVSKINDWIRLTAGPYWHPVGTCAMGRSGDDGAVVGGYGEVYGVDNLWVSDASIMPTIPRCNTQLPALVIGEVVAHALKS